MAVSAEGHPLAGAALEAAVVLAVASEAVALEAVVPREVGRSSNNLTRYTGLDVSKTDFLLINPKHTVFIGLFTPKLVKFKGSAEHKITLQYRTLKILDKILSRSPSGIDILVQ